VTAKRKLLPNKRRKPKPTLLAENLTSFRERAKLSQNDLADRMRYKSTGSIVAYEAGERNPTFEVLEDLGVAITTLSFWARSVYCHSDFARNSGGIKPRFHPVLWIAEMIKQAHQTGSYLGGIGMPLVQLNFDQLLLLEEQPTRHGQDILYHLSGAQLRQWAGREHPRRRPGQQIVRHIGQQDQHLLGRSDLLPTPPHLQAAFIGLDLGFAGATIVIIVDDLGSRPGVHRADHQGLFVLAPRIAPAQRQPLDWTDQLDWGRRRSHPPVVRPQFQPGRIRNLPDHRRRTPPATTFGDDLPVVAQSRVHVAIAPKPGVRTQDRACLLGIAEAQKRGECLQDRHIGRVALLIAGVQP